MCGLRSDTGKPPHLKLRPCSLCILCSLPSSHFFATRQLQASVYRATGICMRLHEHARRDDALWWASTDLVVLNCPVMKSRALCKCECVGACVCACGHGCVCGAASGGQGPPALGHHPGARQRPCPLLLQPPPQETRRGPQRPVSREWERELREHTAGSTGACQAGLGTQLHHSVPMLALSCCKSWWPWNHGVCALQY